MRTISASLALVLAAPAAAAMPVAAEDCPAHLGTIAPKLEASGYRVSRKGSAVLRAAHVESAGRVTIEYRCGVGGLAVAVINQGLADIPFHVLLAAGPGATLSNAVPAWLREREEAVRD
jgi:hypothetical protein